MAVQPAQAFAKAADVLAGHADACVAGIGRGMRDWLTGNCAGDLGEALGIDAEVRREWRAGMLDQRDELLRAIANQFYAGLTVSAQATAIEAALTRYAAAGWRSDRMLEACPVKREADATGLCWAILRVRDTVPSARHIRRILAMG